MSIQLARAQAETYRNEQIRHLSLVLGPRLAVLVPAALDIAERTVGNHAPEKERIEPRERAVEASDEAPVQRKVEVACVVDLASLSI